MDEKCLACAERAVYDAIVKFTYEHGYTPSTRELCELTGYSSTSTIHIAKKALEQKGYIETVPGKNRAILVKTKPEKKIVLCKGCKHRHKVNTGLAVWDVCHKLNRRTDDDFYCAYGEEK